MTSGVQSPEWPIPAWRMPIVAARIAGLLVSLLVCVSLYYALAPFLSRNPIPRLFLGLARRCAGVRLRVVGGPPGRQAIYLSNHVSWLDILALAEATGTAFVAHDGLAQFPPLRWLCALNRTVFVARHARADVRDQIALIQQAIARSGALTIFPEGTTGDGENLLPFKSSLLSPLAAEAKNVPVRPVWLDYGSAARGLAWVGEEPGPANALRLLARTRPILLTVHLLPALADESLVDRKTIARASEAAIRQAMAGRGRA